MQASLDQRQRFQELFFPEDRLRRKSLLVRTGVTASAACAGAKSSRGVRDWAIHEGTAAQAREGLGTDQSAWNATDIAGNRHAAQFDNDARSDRRRAGVHTAFDHFLSLIKREGGFAKAQPVDQLVASDVALETAASLARVPIRRRLSLAVLLHFAT